MHGAQILNEQLENANLKQYVGVPITCNNLRKIFNTIARKVDTKVIMKSDVEVKQCQRQVMVSGEYAFGVGKYPATVFFHFKPNTKTVTLTKRQLNRLIFLFSQTVQHEYVHRYQDLKKRGSNSKTISVFCPDTTFNRYSTARQGDLVYYASGVEVSAHAHDLALEIRTYYPNESITQVLKTSKYRKKLYTLLSYNIAYKNLDWAVLKKTLLKKMAHWYPSTIPIYKVP